MGVALRKRQAGQPAAVVAHAWRAQQRLYKRFHRLKARKHPNVALTAVARELVGFLWAIMHEPAEPVQLPGAQESSAGRLERICRHPLYATAVTLLVALVGVPGSLFQAEIRSAVNPAYPLTKNS